MSASRLRDWGPEGLFPRSTGEVLIRSILPIGRGRLSGACSRMRSCVREKLTRSCIVQNATPVPSRSMVLSPVTPSCTVPIAGLSWAGWMTSSGEPRPASSSASRNGAGVSYTRLRRRSPAPTLPRSSPGWSSGCAGRSSAAGCALARSTPPTASRVQSLSSHDRALGGRRGNAGTG